MTAPLAGKSSPRTDRDALGSVLGRGKGIASRAPSSILLGLALPIAVSAAPAAARPLGELQRSGSAATKVIAARRAPQPLQQHDGLRCGDRLVELGERTAEVLAKCGAPLTRDRWTETRLRGKDLVLVNVEEWVYGADDGSFRRLLRFENGRLRSVEALRR